MQRMQGFAQSQPLFMHLIALHRLRGVASSQSLLLQLGRCWLPGPPTGRGWDSPSAHDHRPPQLPRGSQRFRQAPVARPTRDGQSL